MTKKVFDGKFIKVEERTLEDGQKREIIVMDDAVACIVTNNSNDKLLLVKQYREAAKQDCWEIPAGMLDVRGEFPAECMIREMEEETGLKVIQVNEAYSYYCMVGSCTHKLHMYSTVVEEVEDKLITDDNDVTERKWFTIEELQKMMYCNEIVDGKTINAIFFLLAQQKGTL